MLPSWQQQEMPENLTCDLDYLYNDTKGENGLFFISDFLILNL